MIAKVAKAFIGFQISMGLIKEEDSDVYQYGYIIMAEIALNIVISICLGIWLGEVRGIFFSFASSFHSEVTVAVTMPRRHGNVCCYLMQ